MYNTFKELHKAYGFDNGSKTRDDLTEEEERFFVKDCFDTYEKIGFSETFGTPYTGERKYRGMKFKVLSRVSELKDDKENGADLECLPMWNIELENGDKMAAYPEEICLAMKRVF